MDIMPLGRLFHNVGPHGETHVQRTSVYSSLRVIGFCYLTAADVVEHGIEEDQQGNLVVVWSKLCML